MGNPDEANRAADGAGTSGAGRRFRIAREAPLSPAEALARILPLVPALAGTETVPLSEAAFRTLAAAAAAPRDLPPADVSAMDGYAVREADARVGVPLPVAGTAFAGRPAPDLPAGAALALMTGAPVPAGTAFIVPAEETDESAGQVVFRGLPVAGAHIRRRGAEIRRGGTLLPAGTLLTPPAIGVLAASGISRVAVARRPTVAILPTGDELAVAPEDPSALPDHRIGDANGPLLSALFAREGALPILLPPAPDRADAVRDAIERAARGADLVVTTGGVCAGETDFVDDALEALGDGTHRRFRLAVKPGKPLSFALVLGRPVVALAGNPVAAALAARSIVHPILARMLGAPPRGRKIVAALALPVRPDPDRTELLRGTLEPGAAGIPVARPSPKRESNMLSGLAAADLLLHIPPGTEPLPEGTLVACELLDW